MGHGWLGDPAAEGRGGPGHGDGAEGDTHAADQ